jgi:hypothetical protein
VAKVRISKSNRGVQLFALHENVPLEGFEEREGRREERGEGRGERIKERERREGRGERDTH